MSARLSLWLGIAAAWSVAAADPSPIGWHAPTEIAVGRGEKGPWRQNDSRYDYVDDPTVAVDHRGDIYVAWVAQATKDVWFRRFAADDARPLGEPLNLSRSPATFSWLPRIALAPPDRVFVLWQEIIFSGGSHGGDILFARSMDGGRTFAEPINLSRSIGGDGKGRITRDVWHNGSLDIAASRDGIVYAAWTEYDGALWLARSFDSGGRFLPPQRIATGGKPARAPSLALDANGALHLAWTDGTSATADIQLATSVDRGATFSAPRAVAPSNAYSDAPKLAVDAHGTLHLAYAESDGGPFDRHQVRYTRSRDGGRTFEPARELSRPAPGDAGAGFPALSVDAHGSVFVLWEHYSEPGDGPRGFGLAVSRDGGRHFTPPMLVPGSVDPRGGMNGSQQGRLTRKLAVNDAGAVALVNSALTRNTHSRVWLMRGAPSPPEK